MPDSVIKKINTIGKSKRSRGYRGTAEFLNRTQDKFEWENEDIPQEEGTGEEIVHPAMAAEVPGIRVEADEPDTEPAVDDENTGPSNEERAQETREDTGFGEMPVQDGEIAGVDGQSAGVEIIEIDDDDDVMYDVAPKVEDVDADDERETVSMPDLIKSEDSSDDESDDESDTNDVRDEPLPLGRGHRIRKKPTNYVPALHNQPKRYTEGVANLSFEQSVKALEEKIRNPSAGCNFYEMGKQPTEKEMIAQSYQGAGYNVKSGVVLLNLDEAGPPPKLNEEDIEEHLMGVVLAHQFSLKKGLQKFGDVAEKAVEDEIKQYVEMDCYEPLDSKTLTRPEKLKH